MLRHAHTDTHSHTHTLSFSPSLSLCSPVCFFVSLSFRRLMKYSMFNFLWNWPPGMVTVWESPFYPPCNYLLGYPINMHNRIGKKTLISRLNTNTLISLRLTHTHTHTHTHTLFLYLFLSTSSGAHISVTVVINPYFEGHKYPLVLTR